MERNTELPGVWAVPSDMWQGATVAILASGPSMSQEVADEVYEADIPTIAINTTVKLAPWADMLYAADASWWQHPTTLPLRAAFGGLKVSQDMALLDSDVLVLKNTGRVGFDSDRSCVRTGGNSGYQAIHVAAHASPNRILLLGFDMCSRNMQMHWHGRHPEPLRNASEGIFDDWLRGFVTLRTPLQERGIEVINCTPGSQLTVWPNRPFAEAVGR